MHQAEICILEILSIGTKAPFSQITFDTDYGVRQLSGSATT